MDVRERLLRRFERPGTEYRSVPFWAWNDELDGEELVRQIKQMKEQGMGGFFIHSRDGLETVYMGPEWMDCVRRSVQAAEELGMHVWLYDEDRWPSGFAGGLVQARGGDAFRAKGLTLEVVAPGSLAEDYSDAVALFRAVIEERSMLRCERLPVGGKPELGGHEVLLVFRVEVSERSEWFNNEAPPDNLNPDTVAAFIDITYEAYKREVGGQFGRTVRGVFTDEPSVHDRHCRFTPGRGWLPWSESFAGFFKRRRGYDVLEAVPYLYFDGEKSAWVRHDYWRTLTERFSEAYSKQLGDWCDGNGIAFTGHYLWENNLGTATRVCGAVMPNYRYQQVPGIDMLNEQTSEYITVKQCTSVAHQFGRKQVLTETYGCTGWGFTFEGQKWIGDFQYVLGVNVRSQHLALYSIKGCRKRDYPPVFNYNTSWWKYNHVAEDYFARLSAVLSEGKPVRDVLVLHPASTAWSRIGTLPYGAQARGKDKDVSAANHFGHEFNAFLGKLLRAHYDIDLGDETIMADVGAVRGGKLAVEQAEYSVVVIPPIDTMLESTFRLLTQFVHAGGRIVATGPRPAMIEGREAAERLSQLYDHPNVTEAEETERVIEALEAISPRRVSLTNGQQLEAPELLYMLRELDQAGSRLLFVVNNDREGTHQVRIRLEGGGAVEQWCPLTGAVKTIEAEAAGGFLQWNAELGPAGSALYVFGGGSWAASQQADGPVREANASREPAAANESLSLITELGPVCGFSRTAPNVLTLDRCSYRLGGHGEWSEEMDVWRAQRDVREKLGMRQVYGNGIEQRYKWIHDPHPGNGTPASFRFSFDAAEVPAEPVHLVVESAEQYDIRLNGMPAANTPDGWFLDRSFDKVLLPPLKQGANELTLSCHYHNRMEVEDIYLIGGFALDRERTIIAEPAKLALGDWCLQGYPHYCGSIVYHLDFVQNDPPRGRRMLLELGDYSAVTTEVRVNGRTAGHVPWRAANLVDLTEYLREGENRIDLEVMGSPRNMLGPFHLRSGDPSTTSWGSFRKEGADYTPDYNLRPYGLFGRIRLLSRS
ncbi:glycosyl hydrolase [Paenibacillus doosanensis]|uniref:glycosyl hydrolase n=1 Tax=Paenibacillus doosanensis TaxID=1229154 RepID=UPI0021806FA6|nr:glycosyl hydrolase [Paenibacillus doosanensis]MCS7459774.1 glycosyl hydrolase [Paenibacillus doosanensis]